VVVLAPLRIRVLDTFRDGPESGSLEGVATGEGITVFLADDNLIVREGVRALLGLEDDLDIVGVAADYDELVDGADRTNPQVVVTDIRMPPNFQQEGIDAAREVRKRHPGTGVVILSQYDEPEYAISLLGEGAAGYAYLLKDRVGDGNRLARAIREVATGGSMLDPEIVQALVAPVSDEADLTPAEEELLRHVAEGRPVKAVAAAMQTTPEAVNDLVEDLFLKLAKGASAGRDGALRRLRLLQKAIVDREEQGETLSRMLPGGLAEKLRNEPGAAGRTERLDVTVLMSDVRGYSAIAERTDPTVLAGQLNEHRAAMNAAILEEGGTVMQYVGDAVMAVFGAPFPQDDHAVAAVRAAIAMHRSQQALDARWEADGLSPFGLGIGLSTGEVAAAVLGSAERTEYTLVGDTVNMAQRLQDLARPAGTTVLSDGTRDGIDESWVTEPLPTQLVKGRDTPVVCHRLVEPVDRPALVGEHADGSSPSPVMEQWERT
jgi:adenylate cyclase